MIFLHLSEHRESPGIDKNQQVHFDASFLFWCLGEQN